MHLRFLSRQFHGAIADNSFHDRQRILPRILRQHLAPYKIPSEIRFLSSLPAAPAGKLLKGVMKTMAQQPADASPAPARH